MGNLVPFVCSGPIFTTRKRSLGQGNVFTPVCHSVHMKGGGFPTCITGHITWGEGLPPGGSAFRELGRPPPQDTWDTMGYDQQAGSMHPTGMRSCFELSLFCFVVEKNYLS